MYVKVDKEELFLRLLKISLDCSGIQSNLGFFFKGHCLLKCSENIIRLLSRFKLHKGSRALSWGWGLSTFGGSWGDDPGLQTGMMGGIETKVPRTQRYWTHLSPSEWGSWPQAWLYFPPLPLHPAEDGPIQGGSCPWLEPVPGCTQCSTQPSSPASLATEASDFISKY